jgi:hypothetical protein
LKRSSFFVTEKLTMQRTSSDGGIIIFCDFCSTDWDPETGLPAMIEGHHGSCICLNCVKQAVAALLPRDGDYACPLCLRQPLPASEPRWENPQKPGVFACKDCIHQAAGTLSKDPDVDWKWKRGPGAASE